MVQIAHDSRHVPCGRVIKVPELRYSGEGRSREVTKRRKEDSVKDYRCIKTGDKGHRRHGRKEERKCNGLSFHEEENQQANEGRRKAHQ